MVSVAMCVVQALACNGLCISCDCLIPEQSSQVKQQGLLIPFVCRPSSLLLLKVARNPPRGV